MSYDIHLLEPVSRKVIQLDAAHHMQGGTCVMGGTCEAWLNVTYNYAPHFDALGKLGIRGIYGLTGAQSIPILTMAIDSLKDDVNDDYWKPTEGNAKRALCQLRALAQLRPDGIWDGD